MQLKSPVITIHIANHLGVFHLTYFLVLTYKLHTHSTPKLRIILVNFKGLRIYFSPVTFIGILWL